MDAVAKYIFLFLIGTTVLNLAIALAARVKTQSREFNILLWYWSSLFLNFAATAILSGSPKHIAYSYFFQFIPSILGSKILADSRGFAFNTKLLSGLQIVGMTISSILLESGFDFTISLIPVTTTICIPIIYTSWKTLVNGNYESNWIEKGMAYISLTGIINHYNFAFFRLDPNAAWWGWSISIAQYQCYSVFLPLLINHHRATRERRNVELALEKLSGQNTNYNVEIDDLYRTLELQIGQKEELTRKLQNANLHLEEEREMNEILIKTVSHDLANPLTVINAYIDMLHAGRIPEEDKVMIWDRIKMNTRTALDMIARIRDAIVTRNQASIVAIHDVSIDRSIKRLMNQFDTRLREKNIKLTYDSSIPLDSFVAAEENTLTEHVFANILSNAIKFSYVGSEIKIKVSQNDQGVKVEFRDFGMGIDNERLERRLLHSTEGTAGEIGSGFGVMVMGYFLRKFGASYNIHSEGLGLGTCVTINLKKSSDKSLKLKSMRETANIYS